LIDSDTLLKELINPEAHAKMWEGLIYSDEGRVFLLAAATQYGHTLSEGQIVDETGRPVPEAELEPIIKTAVRQAVAEKPLWRVN
tara:strand:- start:4 stop:258 length:255 start_codon:yes stop_codon:yes gene_type:complete